MQNASMDFKKGDGQTHYFQLPADSWSAGGTLWFAAKEVPDNDSTDALAVINKSFDDSTIISDPNHEQYAAGFVTYQLEFLPNDITSVNFAGGESVKVYQGEFQFVRSTGIPETFPSNNEYIEVNIYADIKRGV